MSVRAIIGALALTFAQFFASEPSHAAIKEQIKYNNWSGGAFFSDTDNSFQTCSVGTGFKNGTYFNIAMNGSGGTSLGFGSPTWMLTKGSTIAGQIKIDDKYYSTFRGVAANANLATIIFDANDPIFEALRKGHLLTVNSEIGSAGYDLTDTAKALLLVKSCADKYKNLTRVNTEVQNWVARNPWFNIPQFQSQRAQALTINNQLLAEGMDAFSPKFYEELDRRLSRSGIDLGQKKSNAVVSESPQSKNESQKEIIISGSGFLISSDSKIITNNHVIASCTSPPHVVSPSGEEYVGKVLAHDSDNDLAIISSDYRSSYYATFRNTPVKVGENVTVAGHPFGSTDLVVTNGIISALSGFDNSTLYTISAPVNHGNSGGALFDASGNVAGVIVATRADAQNTNFAIKSSLVRDFLDRQYISYKVSDLLQPVQTTEVASRAHLISVLILCKGLPDKSDQ